MVGRFVVVVVVVVDEGKKGPSLFLHLLLNPSLFYTQLSQLSRRPFLHDSAHPFSYPSCLKKMGGVRRPLAANSSLALRIHIAPPTIPQLCAAPAPCFVPRFTASPREKNSVMQEEEREKRKEEREQPREFLLPPLPLSLFPFSSLFLRYTVRPSPPPPSSVLPFQHTLLPSVSRHRDPAAAAHPPPSAARPGAARLSPFHPSPLTQP